MRAQIALLLLLCFSFVLYETTLGSGCDIALKQLAAFYQNGTRPLERCFLRFNICEGGCIHTYEHFPQQSSSSIAEEENCQWNYQTCEVEHRGYVEVNLFNCRPVNSAYSSQYDTNNPVQKLVYSAKTCGCSGYTSGQGASKCPLISNTINFS